MKAHKFCAQIRVDVDARTGVNRSSSLPLLESRGGWLMEPTERTVARFANEDCASSALAVVDF